MKGILFKPELIKAIVEGRKTVSRRVMKPQPLKYLPQYDRGGYFMFAFETDYNSDTPLLVKPRYQVGDIVYIKEALVKKHNDPSMPADYITYALDFTPVASLNPNERYPIFGRPTWVWGKDKLSSLFMPAWAARYFIRITDVRAERLQEITDSDIEKEGEPYMSLPEGQLLNFGYTKPYHYVREHFAWYWDSINKPPYDWESNPFVWRYQFELSQSKDRKEA